jgi:transketolase
VIHDGQPRAKHGCGASRSGEWHDEARRVAWGIRRRVLEHVLRNKGGYLSQACSAAEILATLYTKVLNLGPVEGPLLPGPFPGVPGPAHHHVSPGSVFHGPRAPHFDRFILSPSQYALVLYAALIEVGRMDPDGLLQFDRDGSTVEMIGAEHSPGHELMSGSLGQGLSQASGIACARKRKGDSGRVWVFMSDGEFQSGQTWETLQAMAFHKIDNLGIYVDVNGSQCDGRMLDVMNVEPLDARLKAFGARAYRVDGHDPDAFAAPAACKPDGRPLVVLAMTDTCREMEILRANAPKFHYFRLKNDAEFRRYQELLASMR